MSRDELVTIMTTHDWAEAELIKNLLQDHDIVCRLDGERQAGWTGALPIGLLVRKRDQLLAEDVLSFHHVADWT